MRFLPTMFSRLNRVKVRKVAGGALVLRSAGNVFYIKPLSYSKIAVSRVESGEAILAGADLDGTSIELARFSSEAVAMNALDQIYAASSTSWRVIVKRVIYLGIALVVIDSMLGAFQGAKAANVMPGQFDQSSLSMPLSDGQITDGVTTAQPSAAQEDHQGGSSPSLLNCAPQ